MGIPGDAFRVVRRLESGGPTGGNNFANIGGTGIGPTGAPLNVPSSAPVPFDAVLTTYLALIWRDCLSSLEHDLADGPQSQSQTQTANDSRMIPLSTMLGLAMSHGSQDSNPLLFPPNAHVSMMTPPSGVSPNEALRLADAMAQVSNPLAFPPNAHVSMMTPPSGVSPNEALRLADAMAVMEAKTASSSTKQEAEDDDKHPSVGRLTQGQR